MVSASCRITVSRTISCKSVLGNLHEQPHLTAALFFPRGGEYSPIAIPATVTGDRRQRLPKLPAFQREGARDGVLGGHHGEVTEMRLFGHLCRVAGFTA